MTSVCLQYTVTSCVELFIQHMVIFWRSDDNDSSRASSQSATNLLHTAVNVHVKHVYTCVAWKDGRRHLVCVAKVGIFSYINETIRSLPDLAAFFLCMDFSRGYFF